MMEIKFELMNIKVIETEFGTFLYDDVVRILGRLKIFESGVGGAMRSDNDLSEDSVEILNWLVKVGAAKIIKYGKDWSNLYYIGKNHDKILNEITEHERIMEKLIE